MVRTRFRRCPTCDFGVQRAGDQLRAEANAEGGPSGGEPPPQSADLAVDHGISVAVVGADRTAEHDHQIGGDDRIGGAADRVDADVEVADGVPVLVQDRFHQAEVFEGQMPDRDSGPRPVWRRHVRRYEAPLRSKIAPEHQAASDEAR
jgi:hypothetical protein